MDHNILRDHLTKLHEELAAARELDPGESKLLAEIMADIRRLMDRSPPPGNSVPAVPAAPAGDPSLPDRLERLAVRFEVNHPTLAASSRRLVDMLGKVGM